MGLESNNTAISKYSLIFAKVMVMEVFCTHEKLKALVSSTICFGLNQIVSPMPTANLIQERRYLLFLLVQIEPDGTKRQFSVPLGHTMILVQFSFDEWHNCFQL